MQNSTKKREIKFRVWNAETLKMIDPYITTPVALSPQMNIDGVFLPFKNEWPLMQNINLVGKNRVEIYEGDIVKYPDVWKIRLYNIRNIRPTEKEKTEMYKVGEVLWHDGCTWIRNNEGMFCIAWAMTHTGNPVDVTLTGSSFEVIGNIYENPELINTCLKNSAK